LLGGLGPLFVRLAAVVGLVETAALENDARPRTDHAPGGLFAAVRALADRFGSNRLKHLPGVVTFAASIIVGRHASVLDCDYSAVGSAGATETMTLLGRITRS